MGIAWLSRQTHHANPIVTVSALTIHSVRPSVGDHETETFDDVIAPDRLESPEVVVRDFESDPDEDVQWSARLYMWPGEPSPPSWLALLRDGFGDDLDLPESTQSSAVIAVKVRFRIDRFYAVTFGGGRYYLRRGVTEPGYGLRVALNAMYEGDEDAVSLDPANRVRQIEARTVGTNTIRTLRQANREADFGVFDVDAEGDQLKGIVGVPVSEVEFGRRLRGSDTLRVSRRVTFDDIGRLCRHLARFHEKKDYQRRFRFVDNLRAESNPTRVRQLVEATSHAVTATPEGWELAPPALLNFDQVAHFEVPSLDLADPDLSISQIVTEIGDDIDPDVLQQTTLIAVDDEGEPVDQWTLLDCLDGQVTLDGAQYVLDGGEYYLIEPDFLADLDTYIGGIEQSTVQLPASTRVPANGSLQEITEGAYNELAAGSDPDYLLLDKETVTVASKTSAIEICDVLTANRQLIHVKRKFSSSSLSHLFAQGYVSSELFVDSSQYRTSVIDKIGPAHPDFQELFTAQGFVAADFEVVYAIVGDWTNRTLTDLPFFSKINLRKHSRALRRFGYRVTYSPIPVVDP